MSPAMAGALARVPEHEALLYEDPEVATAVVSAFVVEGLTAGEPVILSMPPPRLDDVRTALDVQGEAVTFLDYSDVGRNPARMFSTFAAWAADHPGEPVRVVGEPMWPGRSAAELEECAINEVLWGQLPATGLRTLCPYDVRSLPPALVDNARRTHTAVRDPAGRRVAEQDGLEPVSVLRRALPPPAGRVARVPFATLVSDVRRHVHDAAADAGLGVEATADLVLAVSEIAGNSVRHGGGAGELRWWHDHLAHTLVVEVQDAGRITDPLAGRRPLSLEGTSGRGLGIAVALCDLVQIRSDASGTTIRLQQQLPATQLRHYQR